MTETLITLHARTANTVLLYAFAMGAWSAWNYFRKQGVGGNYFGAMAVGELLMIAQGILGVLLLGLGARPSDFIHFLYGVLVTLMWPLTYVYTHARVERKEAGLYALVAFFIFGLSLRAVMTGA